MVLVALRALLIAFAVVLASCAEPITVVTPALGTLWEQGVVHDVTTKFASVPDRGLDFILTVELTDSTHKSIDTLQRYVIAQGPERGDTITVTASIPETLDLSLVNSGFRLKISTSTNLMAYSDIFNVKKIAKASSTSFTMVILYIMTPVVMLALIVVGSIMMYKKIMGMEDEKQIELNELREQGIEVESEDPFSIQMEDEPVIIRIPESPIENQDDYAQLEEEK
jgi:hypothetical protein